MSKRKRKAINPAAVAMAANGFAPEVFEQSLKQKQKIFKMEEKQKILAAVFSKEVCNNTKWTLKASGVQAHADEDNVCIKYFKQNNALIWVVQPLPLGEVCVPKCLLPFQRSSSPSPVPITYKEWKTSWQSLEFYDLIARENKQTEHNNRLKVGTNLGPETLAIEYKFPNDFLDFKCKTSTISKYRTKKGKQIMSLLNAPANAFKLLVGVAENEKGEGICIGIYEADNLSLKIAAEDLVPTCFPELNGTWALTRTSLTGSSPADWATEDVITLDGLTYNQIIQLAMTVNGEAAWEADLDCGDDNFFFVTPKHNKHVITNYGELIENLENGQTIFKSKSTQSKTIVTFSEGKASDYWYESRKVFSLEFTHRNKNTIYAPIAKDSNHPFNMWLRWKKRNFAVGIQTYLNSTATSKVLLYDEGEGYSRDLIYSTINSLTKAVSEISYFENPKNAQLSELAENLIFEKGLLFITFEEGNKFIKLLTQFLTNLQQAIELGVNSKYQTKFNIVLLIPAPMLTNRDLWSEVKKAVVAVDSHGCTIVDSYVMDAIRASGQQYSQNFNVQCANEPPVSKEQLRKNFTKWMTTPGVDPQFQFADGIAFTSPMSLIVREITDTSGTGVKHIPLLKTSHGCGASSMLLAIGRRLQYSHSTYLIKSCEEGDLHKLLSTLQQPILLLVDDNFSSQFVIKAAEDYVSRNSCLIKVVSIEHKESKPHQVAINPFLKDSDITLVCNKLLEFFPNREGTIQQAADYAKLSKLKFDRHLYFFCLVATTGKFTTPYDWVADLCKSMSNDALLSKCTALLAFTSLFSVSINIKHSSLDSIVSQPPISFKKLFYEKGNETICRHSFLAIFVLCYYLISNGKMKQNEMQHFPNPKHLQFLWDDLIANFLLNHIPLISQPALLNSFLTNRIGSSRFSSFINAIVAAEWQPYSAYGLQKSVDETLDYRCEIAVSILDKQYACRGVLPGFEENLRVTLSRCYRYFAKKSKHNTPKFAT